MRLFWKGQLPLLLFYSLQMALVPLLYWLTGEGRPFAIVAYGLLLSTVILSGYLLYRYAVYRELYRRLSGSAAELNELIQPLGDAPLPEAAHELLQSYYRQVQEMLNRHHSRQEQHITFINRWVHQMKTPLSVIQLTVQELDEPAADSILEELDRLQKGLEMVLYTSRLDNFEHDFTLAPVSLLGVVRDAVADNRKLFIRKRVFPDIRVDEDSSVYTDKKWLRFMLGQLITNAVNYSAGVGRTVTFSSLAREEAVLLEIRDEGIGINKEDLRRVFQPYYTGFRGRQYKESTGMGLYLVKEVADRLGHQVELESQPGQGTTVRLVFPRAHAPS
ncbi:sensor histidine kinase [Paenibacillus sp. TAB 01]|uniref:sensor histidine kinase n=1 Tax=Paenibacillus sp. TAB 01 TaxID=3368988 RepID=UPI0037534EE1